LTISRTFSSYLKKWSVVYAPLGCVGLPNDNTTILELHGTSQCENPFDKWSVQF